eukprot:gene236-biopygen10738
MTVRWPLDGREMAVRARPRRRAVPHARCQHYRHLARFLVEPPALRGVPQPLRQPPHVRGACPGDASRPSAGERVRGPPPGPEPHGGPGARRQRPARASTRLKTSGGGVAPDVLDHAEPLRRLAAAQRAGGGGGVVSDQPARRLLLARYTSGFGEQGAGSWKGGGVHGNCPRRSHRSPSFPLGAVDFHQEHKQSPQCLAGCRFLRSSGAAIVLRPLVVAVRPLAHRRAAAHAA